MAAAAAAEHRAILLDELNFENAAAACKLGTLPTPQAGPGQVVVKFLCRPINPSDFYFNSPEVYCSQGLSHAWKKSAFSGVPGREGMGIIHQVGEHVSGVAVGQRVFSFMPDGGAWQEYAATWAETLFLIPDSITDETAAQFFINPWTVYGMLEELKVPKGDYLLQTAAGSVLGRIVIQLARARGVKTINLVRRNEQKEELKAIGADEVINYTEQNVHEEVKKITGGQLAYGAIECVGGELTRVVAGVVRNSGTVLVYGLLDGHISQIDILDLIFRDIKLQGYHVLKLVSALEPHELHKVASIIFSLMENKVIELFTGEKFPLEKFREAILKSQEKARGGKVLLVND